MELKGHFHEGVILLDEQVPLPEGISVCVLVDLAEEAEPKYRRFRGTPYSYADPFEPGVLPEDWETTH